MHLPEGKAQAAMCSAGAARTSALAGINCVATPSARAATTPTRSTTSRRQPDAFSALADNCADACGAASAETRARTAFRPIAPGSCVPSSSRDGLSVPTRSDSVNLGISGTPNVRHGDRANEPDGLRRSFRPVGAITDYRLDLASKENWSKNFLLGDRVFGGTFNLTHRRRALLDIVLH